MKTKYQKNRVRIKNPIKILITSIFAIMLFVFFAGCTTQPSAQKSNDVKIDSEKSKQNKTEVIPLDNKTGAEKVQEAVASVIPDGNYSEKVTYAYHSGNETVDISVSVKDGIVTNASVTPINPNPISAKIIGNFNKALPDLVVGKRIDSLNIPKQVAGSSLTTSAFKNYTVKLVKQTST